MSRALARGHAGDTIFAPATGLARNAITIIRLSGPETRRTLARLAGGVPPPKSASLRRLRDDAGRTLDEALVLWMPGPGSYTGQDCAELHLHGGRAVLDAVTAWLVGAGLRPADPGEFTFRAHMHGKMDLLEAEAVGLLVGAETEEQRIHALRQLSGEQSAIMASWSDRLATALAWQEALIDFPDESLPSTIVARMDQDLRVLATEMQAQLAGIGRSRRLTRGLVFVLVGAPNVGKSSLLNALAGQDAAIVADAPGTTRDPVSVRIDLDGIPVTLVDTAGLRETSDTVESEGVRRARAQAAAADLVIEVADSTRTCLSSTEADLRVFNKSDLCAPQVMDIAVSALTGVGLGDLRARLAVEAKRLAHPGGASLTTARHAASVRDAASAVERALAVVQPELRAEELRAAVSAVGRITGLVATDDILGMIFGAFCIGK